MCELTVDLCLFQEKPLISKYFLNMTGVTPASFLKTEMKCEVLEKPHVAAIVSRDAESVLRSSLAWRSRILIRY